MQDSVVRLGPAGSGTPHEVGGEASTSAEHTRRNGAVLALGLLVFAYRIGRQLVVDAQHGGDRWRQGDWLISGPVRRGAFGDLVFWLSDATGAAPTSLVVALQAVFIGSFLVATFVALWRLRFPSRLTVLALSPLFIGFWAWDTGGIGRKEIIVYGALSCLLVAPRSRVALLVSSLVFALAVVAHEAMVLFLPVFGVALFVCYRVGAPRWAALAAFAGSVVAAVYALGVTSRSYAAGNPSEICLPLLARGVDRVVCAGAIQFADDTLDEALAFTAESARNGWPWWYLLYALASLATFGVLWTRRVTARAAVMCVAAGIVFAPLWFIAVDWGRWLNFHATSVMVVLILAAHRKDQPVRPLDSRAFWGLLALGLVWMVPHYVEAPPRPGPLGDALATFHHRLVQP